MSSPTFLQSSLYVAVGGALGAWLRFLAGRATVAAIGPVAASAFPWATLMINVAGSFAMGVLVSWLARHDGMGSESLRLLIGVGVLGGFTTFSAFSLEIVGLAERGSLALAGTYAAISVIGGVAGLIAGLAFMRASA
jgi:fluoride exporter